MKKIVAVVSAVFLISIFTACKKYSEDSFISWRTVNQRFHAGQWSIVKILYDGNDITTGYTDSLKGHNVEEIDFKFEKQKSTLSGNVHIPSVYFNFNQKKPNADNYQIGRTTYGIADRFENKKEMGFGFYNGDSKIADTVCFMVLKRLLYQTWTIKQCHGDKMHLRHGIWTDPYKYIDVYLERH